MNFLFFLLLADQIIQLAQLGETQSALQLVHPEVEPENGSSFQGAADLGIMVVAVVVIPFRPQIKFLVIGNHHAAFAGGDCFDVIEAECSHIAEAAQLLPL